jgi:hypothetical protein
VSASPSTATLPDPTDGRAECARCNTRVVLKLDDGAAAIGATVRAFIAAHDHAGVRVTTPGPRALPVDRTPLRCVWCGKRCARGARDADNEPVCAKCSLAGERGEAAE